jgi:hypothetical protein
VRFEEGATNPHRTTVLQAFGACYLSLLHHARAKMELRDRGTVDLTLSSDDSANEAERRHSSEEDT